MKTFKVHECAFGTRNDGSQSITLRTNIGLTFVGADYLAKKAKAIGKDLNEVLESIEDFEFVVTEDYKEYKAGVEYSRKKDDGTIQKWTPKVDNFQTRFSLRMSEDAKLRSLIADKLAKRMSFSIGSMKVESAIAEKPVSQPVQEQAPIDIELED